MANTPSGDLATCACGAVGGIVDQSGRFEFNDVWFVIEHEGGVKHTVVRVREDSSFRFAMR